ncbi:TRC40/GET3/ArsA family transport-energizing ATPase [Aquifex sp.]
MKVVFFGGKGGVGKTTISSAYAVKKAEEGKEVLLISTDPAHSLSDIFQEEIKGEKRIGNRLTAVEIDIKEEIEHYKKKILKLASQMFSPATREQLENLIHTLEESPGIEDVVILEALSRILTTKNYDLAVVDTAPTGHTLGFLKTVQNASGILREVIKIKRKVKSLKEMAGTETKDTALEILEEREKRLRVFSHLIYTESLFIPVLNPERLPLLETRRLVSGLRRIGIRVNTIIVNKVLPEEPQDSFLIKRKEIERKYLKEIEESFPEIKKLYIPLLEEEVIGYERLMDFARSFLSI